MQDPAAPDLDLKQRGERGTGGRREAMEEGKRAAAGTADHLY